MKPLSLATLSALLCASACSWHDGVSGLSFACASTAECVTGFRCITGICRPVDDAGQVTADGGGQVTGSWAATLSPGVHLAQVCSGPLLVSYVDAQGTAKPAPTDLVATVSSAGLGFYGDANCSGSPNPASGFTLPAGASSVPVYFLGPAGTYAVLVDGNALDAAAAAISLEEPSLSLNAAAASSALMGSCAGPFTVGLRGDSVDAGVARPAALNLTFTSSPPGLQTFASSQCAGSGSGTVALAAGATAATFYVRAPNAPGAVTLTLAHAPTSALPLSLSASAALTVFPLARAGRCALTGNNVTVSCAVSPAVLDTRHAFLLFQATADDARTGSGLVRCRLDTPSSVRCSRFDATTPTSVDITWQVFEHSGLTVEHKSVSCLDNVACSTAINHVDDLGQAWLFRSVSRTGNALDWNDYFTASFVNKNSVRIDNSHSMFPAADLDLQVVQWPGTTVAHEQRAGPGVGFNSVTITGLPTGDGGSVAVLLQHDFALTDAGTGSPCTRHLRAELLTATPGSVRFSRGDGVPMACRVDPIHSLAFDLIDFGALATVQQVTVSMPQGTFTQTATLARPVDTARAFVFASNQSIMGQGGGEISASALGSLMGEASSLHEWNLPTDGGRFASSLQLTRGTAQGSGKWTSFVVEVSP